MESPPQPLGAPASIYLSVFGCADLDFRFAGLQSYVPGQLGCLTDEVWESSIKFGKTDLVPYQGGFRDIFQIMSRMSSRNIDTSLFYPFPIQISNTNYYDLDNFDYLCSMYLFFGGSTRLKVGFAGAPASGLVEATIQNTETASSGDNFRGGNGLVASYQPVWPVLDFSFPYQGELPYNTVSNPDPIFAPYYGSESTVSSFFICPGEDFHLYYLLPPPQLSPTSLSEGTFQSYTSSSCFPDDVTVFNGATLDSTGAFLSLETLVYDGLVPGSLTTLSGSMSFYSTAAVPSSVWGLLSQTGSVLSTYGSGDWLSTTAEVPVSCNTFCSPAPAIVFFSKSFIPQSSDLFLEIGTIAAGTLIVIVNCSISASSAAVALNSTRTLTTLGDVFVANSTPDPIPVSLVGTPTVSVPGGVVVTNTTSSPVVASVPAGVNVNNSLVVSVPSGVVVTNTASDPIPASIDTSVPIVVSGSVQVQGVSSPSNAVWISNYP